MQNYSGITFLFYRGKLIIGILFIAILLWSLQSHAQCSVSSSNCKTYQETLNQYNGLTDIIGTPGNPPSGNYNFSSGRMLLIPAGQNFTGGINGNNLTNTMICVAEGATFNPSYMNNFWGTLRNYSSLLTISNAFGGNIENYGGTITVYNNSEISAGKYILNCSGTIQWNSSLNVNGGSIYNDGIFTITSQVSGSGCIFNENKMTFGSTITDVTQQGYTGTITLQNNGLLSIPGEMQGTGTVVNEGWMTIGGYVGQNQFTNNGKVEVTGTRLYFNSSGSLKNHCSFFSNTVGAEFQNNQSIENYGLIYLPLGNWHNQNGTFFNGPTGVVRTQNLTNQSIVTGSGRFYVSDSSNNWNSSAIFGNTGGAINFYDASNTSNPGHFDKNSGTISLTGVFYTPFPMPEYSPDLSNYACGDIILAGSVQPGEIAASQVLCLGINPQGFISIHDAWVEGGGATITYQWQSSTDSINFYNISNETFTTYQAQLPATKTFYRRRAKATYSGADSIKNAMNNSNIVSLTPVNTPPPSITVNPVSVSVCHGTEAQFTGNAKNHTSLRWQESSDNGTTWNYLSNSSPYAGTTTTTLTINPSSPAMNGRQYRLAAISTFCGTAYSSPATLNVIQPNKPIITQQPDDQMLCPDATNALFNVATSSSDISYRWEISSDNGNTWGNISGGNYSGANTPELTVNEPGLTEGHLFRCVLIATCDTSISQSATLYHVIPEVKVNSTPEIKCPDTETALGFNGLDNDYRMGNSRVVFIIERVSQGSFGWEFTYTLTLTNTDLLADNPPQVISQTITVDSANDEYELVFYLENQTEDIVDLNLQLSNVSVEGCIESSTNNDNHNATTTVRRMPAVGAFNAY